MKKKLPQFGWMMPKKQILLFFIALFAALSSVHGQTTFSAGGLPVAIPDPGNVNNTITVSGLPGTVATADEVQINVAISHAWASDIVIGVTPPGGTEVIIVNRIGGGMNIDMSSANVLSFRSNAAAVVTVPGLNGVIPAGIYLPSGANAVGSFASLVGATRNGNWIIRVRDDDSIIQGSLQSASISFFGVGSACPDPPTASVSTQPTCAVPTGTITVTGPEAGPSVTYTLTGTVPVVAAATNATGVFSGLAPGTYEVVSSVDDCVSPAATLVVNAAPSPTTYYADTDQDGFGNPGNTTQACSQPGGYVTDNTDCNDLSAVEKPGQVWYKDTDGDGYAQTGAATITQCARPVGYKAASELASTTGDCNDGNAGIKPGIPEVCNGIDDNCNGSTDEGVLTTYYADVDQDGFGNPANTTQACSQPGGYVTDNTDCNDLSSIEKPGQIWYKDTDNDNYAQTGAASITQCARPTGYKAATELASTTGDCNDNNAAIKPGVPEICDGVDNNCNGMTDDGLPFTTYYTDADGDGYGTGSGQSRCSNPGEGFATQAGDCNDNNAAIKPGATEVCDGVDNNCDGTVDNVLSGGGAWQSANVGTANGNATYPPCDAESNDVFTIQASGFSTSSSDKLHAVYQQLCGNVELIAHVTGVTNGGWAGITLRETLMPGSKKVALKTQSNGNIRREIRSTTNGATSNLNYLRPGHSWLRLARSGSSFVGYTSTDGSTWTFAFTTTVSMTGCIYVGLFSESINANVTTTATFDNVRIIGGGTPSLIEAPHTPEAASVFSPEVYPNPTSGEVNIDLSGYADPVGTVRVFDVFGKHVENVRLDGSSLFRMEMNNADGVYFLSIEVEGMAPVTKRVVIAR
ncbi:MAG: MopE-related protein [Saprospiraceae bacterium]